MEPEHLWSTIMIIFYHAIQQGLHDNHLRIFVTISGDFNFLSFVIEENSEDIELTVATSKWPRRQIHKAIFTTVTVF